MFSCQNHFFSEAKQYSIKTIQNKNEPSTSTHRTMVTPTTIPTTNNFIRIVTPASNGLIRSIATEDDEVFIENEW